MRGDGRRDFEIDVEEQRVLDDKSAGLVEGEQKPLGIRLITAELADVEDQICNPNPNNRIEGITFAKDCPGFHCPCSQSILVESRASRTV